MFNVSFFRTSTGAEPVLDWLRSLTREDRFVVGTDLRTVQFGFPIGMPVCRPLGEGLFEVRSSLPSKKEVRLIFFQKAVCGGRLHQEISEDAEIGNRTGTQT